MSPLDHELRAALSSRAHALSPAADPLPGIEARAGQLRRRRLTGSLAGAALAVAREPEQVVEILRYVLEGTLPAA